MIDLALRQRGSFSPRALFRSGAAGVWFDPSDLGSMSQNSDGTGAAAVDGPVGRILDKSGRGNHAVQPLAAARPMLRRENGLHFLEFAADDSLRAAFAVAQPWERVSAIRQISWTLFARIYGGANTLAGQLVQAGTAPTIEMRSGANIANPGLVIGVNGIVTERHNGAASRIAVNAGVPVTGDGGNVAADGITIGAREGVAGSNSNIRLYGLVMIGRELSVAEGRMLRGFMAARAGIQF
ncbi:MAG TPA: hypothetical protein VGD10_01935 [Allosphingosinicella sp.]|uniref:hypothetical protein n=1 Tax=Allosphingosinicella sp. TaxID=2823234 RepID=UPI002ED7F118